MFHPQNLPPSSCYVHRVRRVCNCVRNPLILPTTTDRTNSEMKFANKHWPKSQNDTTFIWTTNVRECVWPVVLGPKAIFASCIPEIIDLIGTRPKYGGTLKNERGRRWETTCHYVHFNYPQLIGAQLWLDKNPSLNTSLLTTSSQQILHIQTRCPRSMEWTR